MNGIIFDIKHFTVHDGQGIRQTIFLKGCPLSCLWCHNPESQKVNPEKFVRINKLDDKEFKKEVSIGYEISVDDLFKTITGDKIFFEESGGGVTFSGGEPLMQVDFLYNIIYKCKQNEIHTCVDTSGFATQKTIEKIADLTDCFLFDIKLIDNELHKKYTGVPVVDILENLKWLDKNQKNVILRFPVIPGITDTEKNISEIKSFIKSLKNINQIDLLPYNTLSNGKHKRFNKVYQMKETIPLTEKEMLRLKSEFESVKFNVSIVG